MRFLAGERSDELMSAAVTEANEGNSRASTGLFRASPEAEFVSNVALALHSGGGSLRHLPLH